MAQAELMLLIFSGLLFAFFVLNVVVGSFWGNQMLPDVGEMLTLFSASTLFVIAVLQKEGESEKHTGGKNDRKTGNQAD